MNRAQQVTVALGILLRLLLHRHSDALMGIGTQSHAEVIYHLHDQNQQFKDGLSFSLVHLHRLPIHICSIYVTD